MSFLKRLKPGRHRREKAALVERIKTLETALARQQAGGGRAGLSRGVIASSAVLIFASGFGLGTFSEQLKHAAADLGIALGLGRAVSDADAGKAAYEKGDYRTALRLLRPLANQGDRRAQSIVGLMYYHGQGVPPDASEAMKWFRLAAEQGDNLARLHLGTMYAEARNVPQDYGEAAKWYRLAADHGYPHAMYNLGLAYAKGEGVPQDYVSAHMWFNLAAARFPASDTRERNAAIKSLDLVASKMKPEEIAQAQKLAREWKPQ